MGEKRLYIEISQFKGVGCSQGYPGYSGVSDSKPVSNTTGQKMKQNNTLVSVNTLSGRWLVPLLLCAGFLSGCASQSVDPYETLNRKIYAFNDSADRYVLKPIAKGYRAVLPDVVEQGVSNVFSNLSDPFNALNQLLQGKPYASLSDAGRFLINSTVGILGLFDVGSQLGLEKHHEDFGQTLAVWGVAEGPYIVLPFWGPSSPRDGIGDLVGSRGFLPGYLEDVSARNAAYGLYIVNRRAELLKDETLLSGDRYLFIRDAYLQRRQYLVDDGEVEDDFLESDQ